MPAQPGGAALIETGPWRGGRAAALTCPARKASCTAASKHSSQGPPAGAAWSSRLGFIAASPGPAASSPPRWSSTSPHGSEIRLRTPSSYSRHLRLGLLQPHSCVRKKGKERATAPEAARSGPGPAPGPAPPSEPRPARRGVPLYAPPKARPSAVVRLSTPPGPALPAKPRPCGALGRVPAPQPRPEPRPALCLACGTQLWQAWREVGGCWGRWAGAEPLFLGGNWVPS